MNTELPFSVHNVRGASQLLPFHLPDGKSGRFSISHEELKKGEKHCVVSMRNALFMDLRPTSVVLPCNVRIHTLKEKGNGKQPSAFWMSSSLQELEQHHRQLKHFSGRVLVGGLGLGVAVSILHANPAVTTIVVVEKSKDVIKLVHPHIPNEKTLVVRDDLFSFLKKARKKYRQQPFDYAFYDIWCPTGQSIIDQFTLPLRKASIGVLDQSRIEQWNENEMIGQVKFSLLVSEHGVKAILKYSEKDFQENRRSIGPQWVYYNYVRKTKDFSKERAVDFIHCLKDAVAFEKNWGAYEQ